MTNEMPDFLAGLNAQQKEAVTHLEGPLLVLAGAGSGKTRTITHKIAYLLRYHDCSAREVLAVTFTNKAADEMKSRVQALCGTHAGLPWISTFHSFGVRILRSHARRLGFSSDFAICDVGDQKNLLKQVMRELHLTEGQIALQKVRSIISRCKNHNQEPEDYLKSSRDFDAEWIYRIFCSYQKALLKSNAMDFDDLILLTVRLLSEHPEIRNFWASRLRYLLIDEYQDTNSTQYELVKLLSSVHSNITAVGDEDQSIYGFRGADINNILRFETDFPGARTIKLEQNYRSSQTILNAATAVVSNNLSRKGKVLWTQRPAGPPITLKVAEHAAAEAEFVAQQIYGHLREGKKPIAVLYRTNFQSRQFEESLRRLQIPYKLVGGVSFYSRKEVKDALAYLRLAANRQDDISLRRIINEPARGIGAATLDRILEIAVETSASLWDAIRIGLEENRFPGRAHLALERFRQIIDECGSQLQFPLHMALERILEKSGYFLALKKEDSEQAEDRLLNLQELLTLAKEYSDGKDSRQEFLDHVALRAEIDDFDGEVPVVLMTLHNAKGLEFPVVFLAGCEDGLFPHSRAIAEDDLEEERRLCYVGLTRAKEKLYLSYSRRRRFFGRDSDELSRPSRFLREVPEHLTEVVAAASDWHSERQPVLLGAQSLRTPSRKRVFPGRTYDSVSSVREALRKHGAGRQRGGGGLRVGAQIVHEKFGQGKILHIEEAPGDLKVTVQFPGIGKKKLLQRYARLRPV